MNALLPPEVQRRLAAFIEGKKTGRLEIDIRGGHIVGVRLTDAIPVQQSPITKGER